VLQAQGEVENAIVAYVKDRELLNTYQLAAAAQRAVDVSTKHYEHGAVDFTTVLSPLGALRQAQNLDAAASIRRSDRARSATQRASSLDGRSSSLGSGRRSLPPCTRMNTQG